MSAFIDTDTCVGCLRKIPSIWPGFGSKNFKVRAYNRPMLDSSQVTRVFDLLLMQQQTVLTGYFYCRFSVKKPSAKRCYRLRLYHHNRRN